jgi:hypothetical protein
MTPLNQFMDKFNSMPNKFKWAGETLAAAFDVGFEMIKNNWATMMNDMVAIMQSALSERVKWELNPRNWFNAAEPPPAWFGGGRQQGNAQQRLAAQMGKMNRSPELAYLDQLQNMADPVAGPAMRLKKGSGNLAGLASAIGERLSGPLAAAQIAGQGMLAKGKMNLNWGAVLLQSMFTGDAVKSAAAGKSSARLAGGMLAGSSEAYSTIAQSMLRGQSDPVVKATEKQTKELVAKLKPMPPVFNVVNDLLGAFG